MEWEYILDHNKSKLTELIMMTNVTDEFIGWKSGAEDFILPLKVLFLLDTIDLSTMVVMVLVVLSISLKKPTLEKMEDM
ncbi:16547_t:CDS:2 [Funneliformis geosporum]|uniref:16547_t:CDS:1 n=1 Tax=Funneliformis geosporum TaxID=1117311 RepID=A0A9W4SIQ0_9GLOM|nr:16547_t:CDS:2 [Funneliformis geosporum]